MTNNHLLLYRLAELMLKHEKHVLPVDLLFDDERIGDFVKSIQIDSPYQQMLFEGVLTETVKDEKLFVSFTVEGYFHYVLGEVIYKQSEGKNGEFLKRIVEGNKLNGAKEGVEQCLIKEVLGDNLKCLMWLIDQGGDLLDICIVPIANAFLYSNVYAKTYKEKKNLNFKQIRKVFTELLKDSTDNDIIALEKSISYLEYVQQYEIVSFIYLYFNKKVKPNNIKKANLYLKSIAYITESKREQQLNYIEQIENEEKDLKNLQKFYFRLAEQFDSIFKYEKALAFNYKCLNIRIEILGENHPDVATSLINISKGTRKKGDYELTLQYLHKALGIQLNSLGEDHPYVTTSYNNIGTVLDDIGDHEKALEYLNKSLSIRLKTLGKEHADVASSYNNIGSVLFNKGDYQQALELFLKSLDVRLNIYGSHNLIVSKSLYSIGAVLCKNEEYDKALDYYDKCLKIRKGTNAVHADLADVYQSIGSIWRLKGVFGKAIKNLEKALFILKKNNDKNNKEVMNVEFELGLCYYNSKRFQEAIEIFKAIYEFDKKGGYPHYIGLCHEGLNEKKEALFYHLQAAELRKERVGENAQSTLDSIWKCIDFAKQLNLKSKLPSWIKNYY